MLYVAADCRSQLKEESEKQMALKEKIAHLEERLKDAQKSPAEDHLAMVQRLEETMMSQREALAAASARIEEQTALLQRREQEAQEAARLLEQVPHVLALCFLPSILCISSTPQLFQYSLYFRRRNSWKQNGWSISESWKK